MTDVDDLFELLDRLVDEDGHFDAEEIRAALIDAGWTPPADEATASD